MRKELVWIVLILVGVLAGAGMADARTAYANDTLESGDLVFLNEENLNVSQILAGGYTELRTLDGTRVLAVINDRIPAVDVFGVTFPCQFYAYNGSKTDNKYGSAYIMVSDLASLIDGIYLKKNVTTGTAEQQAANAAVINTEEIQYYLKVKSAYAAQVEKFNTTFPNWCDFGIETDGAGYYMSEVKNVSGVMQKIVGPNPADVSESAVFTYAMNDLRSGKHTVVIRAAMHLPTVPSAAKQQEIRVSHTVRESSSEDFGISASKTSVDAGETGLSVTLTGLALQTYTVAISSPSSVSGLTFPSGISSPQGTIQWISNTEIQVTFGESGSIVYPVRIAEDAANGEYSIYMADDNGNTRSVKITVSAIEHVPSVSVPDEVTAGRYASGDAFAVTVRYEHPNRDETVNLYLRSGSGSETLLMSGMSFSGETKHTYVLSTRGFDAGTYTLIARASDGGTARVSFYVSTPTLVTSTSVPDSGILSGDTDLVVTYNARGSPSYLQWYLFGTNLRKANRVVLVPEGTPEEGKSYLRTGTFTIPAEELEGFADGDYYLVVEHPGSDNNFTLTPHCDAAGNLITVTTQSGSLVDIENRQAANAAAAVIEMITASPSDDLHVQERFEIRKSGFLTITGIENQAVGSATLQISGTSSAPAGTPVNLVIIPVSFAPADVSNTAMQMKAGYSAALQSTADPFVRTFSIGGISTGTWYPGTYLAEVSLDDPYMSRSVSFTIGTDGSITSADVKITEHADERYTYTGPTPEPTTVPPVQLPKPPVPAATPTPQNPVSLLLCLAAGAGACLAAWRR